jgi:Holliday junction resolvase RusA-like endonuclease
MIVFTVPGEPQGYGKLHINNYTRRQLTEAPPFRELLILYATQHAPKEIWTDAVVLDLLIFRSPPGGLAKQKRGPKFLDYLAERLRPLTKPTTDSYAHAVQDALEGIIWEHDGQVVDLRVRKYYSEHPRLVVRARRLADLRPRLLGYPELEQDWQTGPPDWIDDELAEWEAKWDGAAKESGK